MADPAAPAASPRRRDRVPLLYRSAAQRLAALAVPLGLLWAAVAWALGGSA